MSTLPWSRDEFEAQLRKQGSAYHIHHPFNVLLNSGNANREQIRGWVANRYYYQISIPIKDAAILSRRHAPARVISPPPVGHSLAHGHKRCEPLGNRW